jgi:hypothetical protein
MCADVVKQQLEATMTYTRLDPSRITRKKKTLTPYCNSRSGYGSKLPSRWMLQIDGKRWHRVYIICYSNSGSAYILIKGEQHFLGSYDPNYEQPTVSLLVGKCTETPTSMIVHDTVSTEYLTLTVALAVGNKERCKGKGTAVVVRPNYNEHDEKGKFFREWRSFNGADFTESRWYSETTRVSE